MSGGGRTGQQWPQFRQAIVDAGIEFTYRFTGGPGDATDIARSALREGVERIVAIGGDGTLNEVLNGFFDAGSGDAIAPEAVLGVLPSGTGADFGRSVSIPRRLATACALLARGDTRRIDVGLILFTGGAEAQRRYFLNIADCGIGGDVANRVNRGRKLGGGKLTFLYHSLAALLSFRGRRLRVEVDDTVREGLFANVVVANGRYFGGSMLIAPDADVGDGLFDVVLLDVLPRRRTLLEVRHVYDGTHVSRPGVEVIRGREVRVTPLEEVPALFDVDGEEVGRAPAVLTCIPGALRVCAPRPGPG
jgi:YegS/Rv2252/BmrU family lipid kinase